MNTFLFQTLTYCVLVPSPISLVFFKPQKGQVRKNTFCEDLIPFKFNLSIFQTKLFLTLFFWYPLYREFFALFTKMEDAMGQLGLLSPESLPLRVKYNILFEPLPPLPVVEKRRGRPPFSKNTLLKALIYKALRRMKTLTDLTFEFQNNPSICEAVGFDLYEDPPSIERFSQFLRETPHPVLQNVRIQLVQSLLEQGIISGKHLVMDSCPIMAKVKENNLKTALSNRFDKTRRPKGDPDARLGSLLHFPQRFKKEVRYFWGYRNHIIADAQEELPLWEVTHPADISELHQAIPLLQKNQRNLSSHD